MKSPSWKTAGPLHHERGGPPDPGATALGLAAQSLGRSRPAISGRLLQEYPSERRGPHLLRPDPGLQRPFAQGLEPQPSRTPEPRISSSHPEPRWPLSCSLWSFWPQQFDMRPASRFASGHSRRRILHSDGRRRSPLYPGFLGRHSPGALPALRTRLWGLSGHNAGRAPHLALGASRALQYRIPDDLCLGLRTGDRHAQTPDRHPGLPRWLRGLVCMAAVSIIVQVMLWPLFANTFGRGSLVGVLANLILVPASGLLMAAGFGAWLAALWARPPAAAGPVLAFLARLFMARLPSLRFLASRRHRPLPHERPSHHHLLSLGQRQHCCIAALESLHPAASAGCLLWAGTAAAGHLARPALSVLLPAPAPRLPCTGQLRGRPSLAGGSRDQGLRGREEPCAAAACQGSTAWS